MSQTRPHSPITGIGPVRRLLDGAKRRRREIEVRRQLRELEAQLGPVEEELALVSLRRPVDWDAVREGRAWR